MIDDSRDELSDPPNLVGLPEVQEQHLPVLEEIERLVGHEFAERGYLLLALTHPSVWEEAHVSYERLEFLGDSVLGLIISDHLFHRFPDSDEGELTRIKSSVVSRAALARMGRALEIGRHLVLGKGMQGALPRSVTANATEALIGAIYLDAGLEVTTRFVLEHLAERVRRALNPRGLHNPKTNLQHLTQSLGQGTPRYRVLSVEGPHHQRVFEVCAMVEDRSFTAARGSSKKIAEQRAARLALRELERELDEPDAPPAP